MLRMNSIEFHVQVFAQWIVGPGQVNQFSEIVSINSHRSPYTTANYYGNIFITAEKLCLTCKAQSVVLRLRYLDKRFLFVHFWIMTLYSDRFDLGLGPWTISLYLNIATYYCKILTSNWNTGMHRMSSRVIHKFNWKREQYLWVLLL